MIAALRVRAVVKLIIDLHVNRNVFLFILSPKRGWTMARPDRGDMHMTRFLATFFALVVLGYMAMVVFLPTPQVASDDTRTGGRDAAARLTGEAATLVAPSDHGMKDQRTGLAGRAS